MTTNPDSLEKPLDQLTDSNRILRFFQVNNDHPRSLSSNQIHQYNEKGYILGLPVFTQDEMKVHRKNFNSLMATLARHGKDSYAINGFHASCQSIYELVQEPRILDYVQDILGSNFVCWGTHYFCKMPHDGKSVAWHQDATYWPLSPSQTVTVWLAIDDADEENSAMRVIPGTHLLGGLKTRATDAAENNVLSATVDHVEKFGMPVHMSMKAGEMSLHADLLLHGSLPNHSNRRRCGLTMRYAHVDVRSYKGWNTSSIIVRGHDKSNHWANIQPPRGDHPLAQVQKIGGN